MKLRIQKKLNDLKKAFESEQFLNNKTKTLIPVGIDSEKNFVFEDLKDLKSIIMAGATGTGKSNFAHCVISSLLQQEGKLSLVLCDCKRCEFSIYKDLNCLIGDVATGEEDIKKQLNFLNTEIQLRSPENDNVMVVIIDEYSDAYWYYPDFFKETIMNLTKNGPGLNIFLIMYTSRPDPEHEMPEELRDSFFTQIAFNTASPEDSKAIIGEVGAEKLLGNGDMLFKTRNKAPKRLQGFYMPDQEMKSFIKEN
jgi:DNA segregation ATPase FtsK/SpoIIIE-like protein